jgi:hypothetical protein
MKKKVAILFYGLTRTLEKTINSIKEKLLTPLNKNNYEYDIFIHTYKIHGSYTNIWSGESVTNYINEDIEKILNPKYYIFDDQETIINTIDFNEYYTKLGNWSGSMSPELTKYLIKNMCLALYSKKQITLLFEQYKDDYDYAIIIRPDMRIDTKIDINRFKELNNKNIILPSKHWFHGCNDRFCIGKPDIILYCGKLFDELKEYSCRKSIISELFFKDKLNEKSISIITADIEYENLRI